MQGLSSTWGEIHVGVSQGSILGPLLFSIYMNDLPNVVQICEQYLYADDMKMHCSDANLTSTEGDLQQDIQSVNSWLCVNLLTLNIRKSNVMLINSCPRLKIMTCVLVLMVSSFPMCLQSSILVFLLMKICHGTSLTAYVPCLLSCLLNYIMFLCYPFWITVTWHGHHHLCSKRLEKLHSRLNSLPSSTDFSACLTLAEQRRYHAAIQVYRVLHKLSL